MRLTNSDKWVILQLIDKKMKYVDILRKLDADHNIKVGVSTIGDIKRDRCKLEAIMLGNSQVPQGSKVTEDRRVYPDIDSALHVWFQKVRFLSGKCKPLPVMRQILQIRAQHEAKLRNITDFKAPSGYIDNWRWRYGIQQKIKLHGEAGDVNIKEMDSKIDVLRNILSQNNYSLENIFNMDESGLSYRRLQCESYVLPG